MVSAVSGAARTMAQNPAGNEGQVHARDAAPEAIRSGRRGFAARIAGLVLAASAALVSFDESSARADDPVTDGGSTSKVAWKSEWPRMRWWEYGVAAASWGTTITSGYVLPDTPFGWRGRNDFDESIRDGLRWSSASGRLQAASASDIMFYSLAAFPIVVDGLLVTWGIHKKPDVAFQLIMTDIEALGFAGLLSSITERTGRERPYVRTCPAKSGVANPGGDPAGTFSPEAPCDDTGRNQSFVSGHTAAAFAGAGLVCVHHESLPLFGARAADIATCSAALGTATLAGYLRVAADVHYATDVLAAAGIGLGSGLVLPYLLRFRSPSPSAARGGLGFSPMGGRDTLGLTVYGKLD